MDTNPFSVGEIVIYKPSHQGYYSDVNGPPRLVPGHQYRVAAITGNSGTHVVVEYYDHPGGGLYWSEFSPVASSLVAVDNLDSNPFSIGKTVVYRPTEISYSLNLQSPPEARLVPGNAYEIIGIDGPYILVMNDYFLEGRIYWTEFAPCIELKNL